MIILETILSYIFTAIIIIFAIMVFLAILCVLIKQYSNAFKNIDKELNEKMEHCNQTMDNLVELSYELDEITDWENKRHQEMTHEEMESIAFQPLDIGE